MTPSLRRKKKKDLPAGEPMPPDYTPLEPPKDISEEEVKRREKKIKEELDKPLKMQPSKYASLERDKEGRLTVAPIQIEAKASSKKKVFKRAVVIAIILIVISSGLTLLSQYQPTPSGYEDWNNLTEYYVVSAWAYKTETPSEHVLTAMRLYAYNESGDTWNLVLEHGYINKLDVHSFGKVPLGVYVCVRASEGDNLWSAEPSFTISIMLNGTGTQNVDFVWGSYTVHLQGVSS